MALNVAISTCGPMLEVALRTDVSRVASTVRLAGVSPRSTLVLAALDLLVEDAGSDPEAIDVVVVSRGPGSFTGIRSGLATAAGLAEATGARCVAFDSLVMQAARCSHAGVVWAAQPGRRGEAYVQSFRVAETGPPEALSDIEIAPRSELASRSPLVASEGLVLPGAERLQPPLGAAEALLDLAAFDPVGHAFEPLYVEGPPIHGGGRHG